MPVASVVTTDPTRSTVTIHAADEGQARAVADALRENQATVGATPASAAAAPPPPPAPAPVRAAAQPFYAPAPDGPDQEARTKAIQRARGLTADQLAARIAVNEAMLLALPGGPGGAGDPGRARQRAELRAGLDVLTAETARRERAARGRALGQGMG
ncbi:hypothetical protein GAY33_34055 [Azospirillum brasilense]|uniref:hypothetical protein n=1 Tax=Azospirillum argentinense TaxID=2970906 RepID=UPI00190ED03A|nr:hypothetical protein [Azospirillum argentinense]MBK3804099.1 hypothetical protein [Azospirillum argentinense]